MRITDYNAGRIIDGARLPNTKRDLSHDSQVKQAGMLMWTPYAQSIINTCKQG